MKLKKNNEDNSLKNAKRKFLFSLLFLAAGFLYWIFPFDIIPDILVPFGWADDITALVTAFIYSGYSYRKVKKAEEVRNPETE